LFYLGLDMCMHNLYYSYYYSNYMCNKDTKESHFLLQCNYTFMY